MPPGGRSRSPRTAGASSPPRIRPSGSSAAAACWPCRSPSRVWPRRPSPPSENSSTSAPVISESATGGSCSPGWPRRDDTAFVIDVLGARNTTVVGNRAIGNVAGGIDAVVSINTTVAKNHVIGSPETKADGIVVQESSRTKVVNNDVRSTPEGIAAIAALDSIDTTVANNTFTGNAVGIVDEGSTGTKIVSNDITDSTVVGTVILDSTGTKIVSNDISRSGETGITIS